MTRAQSCGSGLISADPDPVPNPGFWWPKLEKNLQLKKIGYFFIKIEIWLSLDLHKGRTSYRRSLQPSKKNIQHFKTWKFKMRIRIQQLKLMRIHNPARPSPSPINILVLHCKDKIPKFRNKMFPEKEYRGLSPNFHIHASVSDLYISTIGLTILLEEIYRPILGLYKSLTDTWMWKLGLTPRYSQKRNM